ncbi:MAG TPA: hypothetical protein VL576_02640 [Candidatus Paceibacterota bacterium]|jgi:hypothetical protein|nr:hypothetical protein [Candidatus Paceibacterota bacterium]
MKKVALSLSLIGVLAVTPVTAQKILGAQPVKKQLYDFYFSEEQQYRRFEMLIHAFMDQADSATMVSCRPMYINNFEYTERVEAGKKPHASDAILVMRNVDITNPSIRIGSQKTAAPNKGHPLVRTI